MEKIIYKGAEAEIVKLDGKKKQIVKRRVSKDYRIDYLDKRIRKLRTRSEGRILERADVVASVPKVIDVDENKKEIVMEYIEGLKLSENLNSFEKDKQIKIMLKLGKEISKLHDADIIHGDLTTSNMILKENGEIYLIDFGLAFMSHKIEDRAVDIHLLKEALESKHYEHWQDLFESFLKGYRNSKKYDEILKRLKKVEKRGRYRF